MKGLKYLKRAVCFTFAAVFTATSCIHGSLPGMAVDVSAAEVTSKITIDGAVEGHTYKVYQIFKGNVSADGVKLSNVKNGANYTSNDIAADLAVLEADGADAKAFIKEHRDQINTVDPVTILTVKNPSADLEPGYYLVMDESDGMAANDAISDYIVSVVGNVTVKPKAATVPGFDKSVDDGKDAVLTILHPQEGYTYNAYQMFAGDMQENGVLSPVRYGSNYHGRSDVTFEEDIAAFLSAADEKTYAEEMYQHLSGRPEASMTYEMPSVEVEMGYYIVMSADENGRVTPADAVVVAEDSEDVLFTYESFVDLSPEAANDSWNYTLDESAGTITLNYYTGTKTDVKVYSHYKVNGSDKIYKTRLANNKKYTNTRYMFFGNSAIESVVFSNEIDTSSCTGMARMFMHCASLKSINFGLGFDTSNVTDMNYMFYGCSSLNELSVRIFDTKNLQDMSCMFSLCHSMSSIDLSMFNTGHATTMRCMFTECTNYRPSNSHPPNPVFSIK